jgi:acetyltransferase-like isoleucine patch superfamily enzyme
MDIADITGAWDYATLPANIRLGRDCFIEQRDCFDRCRSERDPAVVLGDRVRVYAWTRFSLEPTGTVEVGDDSTLVGAMFMGGDRITIGRRTIVSHFVTIADCDFHPRDPAARRVDAEAIAVGGDPSLKAELGTRPVTVGDDVWIGIGAIVLKGATIGDGARIEPGAVVTREVPPGAVVAGNPGRLVSAPER